MRESEIGYGAFAHGQLARVHLAAAAEHHLHLQGGAAGVGCSWLVGAAEQTKCWLSWEWKMWRQCE